MKRIKRRNDRPMVDEDPEATLKHLMDARYPIYAEADITVQSRDVPHDAIVDEIMGEFPKWPIRLPAGEADYDGAAASKRADRGARSRSVREPMISSSAVALLSARARA